MSCLWLGYSTLLFYISSIYPHYAVSISVIMSKVEVFQWNFGFLISYYQLKNDNCYMAAFAFVVSESNTSEEVTEVSWITELFPTNYIDFFNVSQKTQIGIKFLHITVAACLHARESIWSSLERKNKGNYWEQRKVAFLFFLLIFDFWKAICMWGSTVITCP